MAKKYQGWYSTPAFCIERMASHLVLYITCLLDIKTKVFVFIKIHFLTLVFLNLKQERHKKKRGGEVVPMHCMAFPVCSFLIPLKEGNNIHLRTSGDCSR